MQMNGLKLSNSWSGYHVLLNPDYSAALQWRFVNRAIDEARPGAPQAPPAVQDVHGRHLACRSRRMWHRAAPWRMWHPAP